MRHLERINEARNDLRNPNREELWSEAQEALYDDLYPWWEKNEKWRAKWDARPVAVVTDEDGTMVAMPTTSDCRYAYQLLIELMHESGLLVRTRNTSGPQPRVFEKEAPHA